VVEGTIGWAKVGIWLTFKSPTAKWANLVKAIHYSSLRDAEKRKVGGMPLPPEKDSAERLLAAGRATVKSISKTYAGYYMGVVDVGLAVSDEARAMGLNKTADLLAEAAHLWHLRARCYRATNLVMLAHDEPTPSRYHYRVHSDPMDLCLVPAPYRAFDAYRTHAFASPLIPNAIKSILREPVEGRVAGVFLKMNRPIAAFAETVVTRYLVNPYALGRDMERAWVELQGDIEEVAEVYGAQREREIEVSQPTTQRVESRPFVIRMPSPPRAPVGKMSYFDIMSQVEPDEAEGIEDQLDELDPETSSLFIEGFYESYADMSNQLHMLCSRSSQPSGMEAETVR